jgi:hypothetical protein
MDNDFREAKAGELGCEVSEVVESVDAMVQRADMN